MDFKIAKSMVIVAVAVSGAAFAQTKAPEPDYTLSYNVGVVSDYRYRGISQSRLKPALQGGIDFAHKNGFYLGTWASTIKWIKDAGGDAPVEWDIYGGYKFEASGIAFDVGALRYQYLSHKLFTSPNTTEAMKHTAPNRRPVIACPRMNPPNDRLTASSRSFASVL